MNSLEVSIEGFNREEVSVIVEAAYYAMRHHYEDFAEHIDLADDYLKPIVSRFIEVLNN